MKVTIELPDDLDQEQISRAIEDVGRMILDKTEDDEQMDSSIIFDTSCGVAFVTIQLED